MTGRIERSVMAGMALLLLWPLQSWSAPRIACDEGKHSFGNLFEVAEVSHTFVLKNTGDAPLKIEKVQTSCGCAQEALDKKVIEPGGTGRLSLTVSLAGRQGEQEIVALIHSNDPQNPRYTLSLKGAVRRGVEVKPGMLNIHTVVGDPVYEQEVEIAAGDGKPFKITGVETGSVPFASVRLVVLEPGLRSRLKIGWQPDAFDAVGTRKGKITIKTDRPKYREIGVDMQVTVMDEFVSVPPELEIQRPPEGAPDKVERYLLIKSLRKRPIAAVEVVSPVDGVQIESKATRPDEYAVKIGDLPFRANLDGKVFKIRIRTADGSEKTLEVPVRVRK